MTLISEMMIYSSFWITTFPIGLSPGVFSYSVRCEEVDSWENLHLLHEESVGSFVWWSCRSGEKTLR